MRLLETKNVDTFRWLILTINISVTIVIGALVIQTFSRDSMVLPRLPDPREGGRRLRSKPVRYDDFAVQVAFALRSPPEKVDVKPPPTPPEVEPDRNGPLALLFEFGGGMFYRHGSARNFAWLEPRTDNLRKSPPRVHRRHGRRTPRRTPMPNRNSGKLLRTGDRWEVPESDGVSLRVLEIGPNGLRYSVDATGKVHSLQRETRAPWWQEKDGHVIIDPTGR